MVIRRNEGPVVDSLGLSMETLAFIIVEARAFDAQQEPSRLEDGSNPADDREVGALEGGKDNPTSRELRAAIANLTEDEKIALVALTWIGRGDFEPEEWPQALRQARERKNGATARYLMGIPLLGDYLEEGAAALGYNLSGDEASLFTGG